MSIDVKPARRAGVPVRCRRRGTATTCASLGYVHRQPGRFDLHAKVAAASRWRAVQGSASTGAE